MHLQQETIAALATPVGESAIAVLRLSGPLCSQIALGAFGLKEPPQPRIATYGAYHDSEGRLLDHVVYIYYSEGRSYTGAAMLEISCHGNAYISRKVLEDLIARGCRAALPGEFTRTAFLNGKLDLSQAEAVLDVIRARSDRALQAAQQQLAGALGAAVARFSDRLLHIIAETEAYIDFPEEDLPTEDTDGPAAKINELLSEIAALERTQAYGALLHEGVNTVIVGAPNVGKSSLLNTLIGEDRAIVSPQPGTTRDFIAERIQIGPYWLRMIDTAGVRSAASGIERLGIEKTLERIREADCCVLILDSAAPIPELPKIVKEHLKPGKTLVVENKIDLPQSRSHASFLPECPHCRLSLRTGEGLPELHEQVVRLLEKDCTAPTEDALIVNVRHAAALRKTCSGLEAALSKLTDGDYSELIASDLREALEALSEIAGKIDNEAMLDKLFSRFCIGK